MQGGRKGLGNGVVLEDVAVGVGAPGFPQLPRGVVRGLHNYVEVLGSVALFGKVDSAGNGVGLGSRAGGVVSCTINEPGMHDTMFTRSKAGQLALFGEGKQELTGVNGRCPAWRLLKLVEVRRKSVRGRDAVTNKS